MFLVAIFVTSAFAIVLLLIKQFAIPTGKIDAVASEHGIDFNVDYGRTNGLLRLQIFEQDPRSLIWDVNLHYFHEPKLSYGEVPQGFITFNGSTNSAAQVFPANGAPEKLRSGEEYVLKTDWQYDRLGTAQIKSQEHCFRTPSNGSATVLVLEKYQSPSESTAEDGP